MSSRQENIWMHIGAGSFHRAHQAYYLHLLRQSGEKDWSIALGNIRDDASSLLETLQEQDGRYVLETVSPDGERDYTEITSIRKILPWDKDISSLVKQGCDPQTRIISFTVTEGGYYLDTQHRLNPQQPDIKADLSGEITTIYGALARILEARRKTINEPITLLSCDNVRHNGERFRNGFLSFLELINHQDLLEWVRNKTTSPNTMVDRITPRPTPDIAERVKQATGITDKAPVMGESFIQWVIENTFINGRPPLEKVGVEVVESVQPWEEAKIRVLNAPHSCIAWAGTLIGKNFIHESVKVNSIHKMAWNYVTEDVIPCLNPSPLNLEQYRDVVLYRFSNPYIKDTNQRVAADGLSKTPGFITPTLIETYKRGQTPQATTVLPALFFIFLQRWHKNALPYPYEDGILHPDEMHKILSEADPLQKFATDPALFGSVAQNPQFVDLLRNTVKNLENWLQNPDQPWSGK
ncbi:D-arabinitol 4-dehydrogenase [Entomobacter blattae]|uniref:Mannitol 2-dehydrogenase n=1 Tax=Entomobacter blattae TaxID=2762277 RepID=A0A7H1NNM5_9PROT|nr:D-arabinitol 4-dehydrogenase [Entomobacter blattae]QNT77385.1 Mannitol 2-dehydrogenase [Entomobacter blattae]